MVWIGHRKMDPCPTLLWMLTLTLGWTTPTAENDQYNRQRQHNAATEARYYDDRFQ